MLILASRVDLTSTMLHCFLTGSAEEHCRQDLMMFNLTGEVGHQKDVDKICRNSLVLEMSPQEIYLVRFKTFQSGQLLGLLQIILWVLDLSSAFNEASMPVLVIVIENDIGCV